MKKVLLLLMCVSVSLAAGAQDVIKSYVINIENNKAYLDITKSKAKVGDVLSIREEAGYMVHPVTKKKIKKEGSILADLEIVEVYGDYSVATIYPEEAVKKIKVGMVAEMTELPVLPDTNDAEEDWAVGAANRMNDSEHYAGNNSYQYVPVMVPSKVTVRSGTPIELQSLQTIYARKAEIGDAVKFKVLTDVRQDGIIAIPAGTIATGTVTKAKKSSLAGTKGRLSIAFKYLTTGDGSQVPLDGNVYVSGKNRTPLAVITALFVTPCIFIPGTKAVLTTGHYATATVRVNTEITVGK